MKWLEFRAKLLARGYTLSKLANEIGCDVGHLYKVLRGQRNIDTELNREIIERVKEIIGDPLLILPIPIDKDFANSYNMSEDKRRPK